MSVDFDYSEVFAKVGYGLDEAAEKANWDEEKQIEVLLDFIITQGLGMQFLQFANEEQVFECAARSATTDEERCEIILEHSRKRREE